jgi:hypothetical protein
MAQLQYLSLIKGGQRDAKACSVLKLLYPYNGYYAPMNFVSGAILR